MDWLNQRQRWRQKIVLNKGRSIKWGMGSQEWIKSISWTCLPAGSEPVSQSERVLVSVCLPGCASRCLKTLQKIWNVYRKTFTTRLQTWSCLINYESWNQLNYFEESSQWCSSTFLNLPIFFLSFPSRAFFVQNLISPWICCWHQNNFCNLSVFFPEWITWVTGRCVLCSWD